MRYIIAFFVVLYHLALRLFICLPFGHSVCGKVKRLVVPNSTSVRARQCSRCRGWIAGGVG